MTMNSDSNLPQDAALRRFAQLVLPNRLNSLLGINQDVASRGFAQLGLLVGSLVFSEEDQSDQQPQRLTNLMKWALNPLNLSPMLIGEKFYFPQLGVRAQGLALIYFTHLLARGPAFEAEIKAVTKVLNQMRIPTTSTSGYISDPNYYQYFEKHFDDIAKYFKRLSQRKDIAAMTPRNFIWLDPQDIGWWVEAIGKTLNDYLLKIRKKELTVPIVQRLGERLECSVFAPLDISQPLPIPGLTAVDSILLYEEMQNQLTDLSEKVDEIVRRVYDVRRESRYLYLTWDLLAFDFWMDQSDHFHLVQRTMLALWTAWPQYSAWAPPPPEGFSSSSFSLKEATHLLTDLLPALRRYFFAIKDAHHLPSPQLTFLNRGGKSYVLLKVVDSREARSLNE